MELQRIFKENNVSQIIAFVHNIIELNQDGRLKQIDPNGDSIVLIWKILSRFLGNRFYGKQHISNNED